jgi:hypothetical protein
MLDGGQIDKIYLTTFVSLRLSLSVIFCSRLGIDTASDEYLAAYVRRSPTTPPISLDRVMKSVWLLEQMGRARLGLRQAAN